MGRQKISGLNGTTAFIEMIKEQLKIGVPGFKMEIKEDAPDNFGIHWRGWRAWVTSGDLQMYIHTGLVYHPDTRAGIYTEIDRKNNSKIFDTAWERITFSDQYDLCKEEADYLKFFYPAGRWDDLMEADPADKQIKLWRAYFESVLTNLTAALGIESGGRGGAVEAGMEQVDSREAGTREDTGAGCVHAKRFSFAVRHLHQLYDLTKLFTEALEETVIEDIGTEVHKRASDRFGTYSAGARLFVHDGRAGRNLYLWCGLLFTDAKRSGLIIEVDRYSNQDSFETLQKNLKISEGYETEVLDGFIKLFLPSAYWQDVQEMVSGKEERSAGQILASFIQAGVKAFMEATVGIDGVNEEVNEEVVYAVIRAVATDTKISYGELAATFSQTPGHKEAVSDPQSWMEAARAGIKKAAGSGSVKAILSVNPEGVAAPDRYTLYMECSKEPDMVRVSAEIDRVLDGFEEWTEKVPPVYDGKKITVILERTKRRRII